MRILFLNDLHDRRLGSSVRQMYQEAERLMELGHEPAIVSVTQDPSQVGETNVGGIPLFLLHSDYPFRFRAWVSVAKRSIISEFGEILGRWKPDVVHSHIVHTHLSYGVLTEARRQGVGVVFTAHDAMTFCYHKLLCSHGGEKHQWARKDYRAYAAKCVPCQRFRFRPGRNRVISRILKQDVDRVTVVSHELGDALRANDLPVHRTIHNAIQLQAELPKKEAVDSFRRKLGVENNLLIAIGGRLNEQKGISQLFRMMGQLRHEFPSLRLLVMGDEDLYRNSFEHTAIDLGVEDLVVPTGWLNGVELACAYSALDVLVTPSICFETFGLLNLEAMEYSKPVVATTFGGCPEVVQNDKTGFTANPFHMEEFAERIAMLLRDPALRRRMGDAGRQMAESYFSIERLTDEFLEEYELAMELAQKRQMSHS